MIDCFLIISLKTEEENDVRDGDNDTVAASWLESIGLNNVLDVNSYRGQLYPFYIESTSSLCAMIGTYIVKKKTTLPHSYHFIKQPSCKIKIFMELPSIAPVRDKNPKEKDGCNF